MKSYDTGADLGFFFGGGASLGNGITNTKKPHFLNYLFAEKQLY